MNSSGRQGILPASAYKRDSGGGLVIPGRINRLTVRGQRLMSLNAVPKIVARLSKS